MTSFGLIAAHRSLLIGLNSSIPWTLPLDRAYFKSVTKGATLIMGRVTFQETGFHLPHAGETIVITRGEVGGDGVRVARGLEEALGMARFKPWVVGGEKLYREGLLHRDAREVHLSVVDEGVGEEVGEGDVIARFPDHSEWEERFGEPERVMNEVDFHVDVYRRNLGA